MYSLSIPANLHAVDDGVTRAGQNRDRRVGAVSARKRAVLDRRSHVMRVPQDHVCLARVLAHAPAHDHQAIRSIHVDVPARRASHVLVVRIAVEQRAERPQGDVGRVTVFDVTVIGPEVCVVGARGVADVDDGLAGVTAARKYAILHKDVDADFVF